VARNFREDGEKIKLYIKNDFMKKRKTLLYILPFLLFACNNKPKDSVQAADSTNEVRKDKADSTGAYQADAATSDFLVKAANGGMAEVKMGELASQKSANSKVKGMGEMMVRDHTAGNAEVKTLAGQLNVNLPATVGEDKQKAFDDLSGKKGKDFDKAFVDQMIRDHKEAIDLFKKAVDDVKDPNVRTFANNTLPKLQMHLDSFKVVQKIIK
jgi:putative membrane protein